MFAVCKSVDLYQSHGCSFHCAWRRQIVKGLIVLMVKELVDRLTNLY